MNQSSSSGPISCRELLAKQFSEAPYWISDGLLSQKSMLVMGGPPKSYKSFLVNSLIYGLTTATPIFTASFPAHTYFQVPRPVKVLLLEQEIGAYDLKLRFEQLANAIPKSHGDLFTENLYIHSQDHGMQLGGLASSRAHMADLIQHVQPQVVVLDPLVEFHSADENRAQDMIRVLRDLDWLRERFGFATIMVHHTAKLNEMNLFRAGTPDQLRGSSVIHAKADSFIMLHLERNDPPYLKLNFTLRRGRPIPKMYVRANPDSMLFTFDKWDGRDEKAKWFAAAKPN